MRWDDQAQFHPVNYLKGLAATLPGDGCRVFENIRVTDWDPHRIATEAGSGQGPARGDGDAFAARQDRPLLRREFSAHAPGDHGPRRSRAGAGRHVYQRRDTAPFDARPSRRRGPGLDDLHRPQLSSTAMSTSSAPRSPRSSASPSNTFGVSAPTIAGPTRIIRPPITRPISAGHPRSTTPIWSRPASTPGGISTGTAAAILIADLIEGRDNRWLDLFDATRIKPVASAAEFVARHGRRPRRSWSAAISRRSRTATTSSRRARRRS